uniref:Alternative protein MRC1 n=1 Tax=Homo sapiens TaxID=9606 RepID=L8E7Q9_HUMAN|nr:alternative protein MRC1 [Homo sapiens]
MMSIQNTRSFGRMDEESITQTGGKVTLVEEEAVFLMKMLTVLLLLEVHQMKQENGWMIPATVNEATYARHDPTLP